MQINIKYVAEVRQCAVFPNTANISSTFDIGLNHGTTELHGSDLWMG